MTRNLFSSDTRHMWIVLAVILGGVAMAVFVRGFFVPETFGRTGPYREAAIGQIAALRSAYPADQVCHECHEDVKEERADSAHTVVRCAHCHGLGRRHIEQARAAKTSPGTKVDPAAKWDGNFKTKQDLYSARHRNACLVCHELEVGKPDDFLMIDLAEHLADTEPEKPDAPDVCLECHGYHNTETK